MRNLYLKQVHINIFTIHKGGHFLILKINIHPNPTFDKPYRLPNPIIIIIITFEYNNKLSLAM